MNKISPADEDAMMTKLGELFLLVIELREALNLERGGGTPLSTNEYLDLNNRARAATFGLDKL